MTLGIENLSKRWRAISHNQGLLETFTGMFAAPMASPSRPSLTICIDFGTTTSKAAFYIHDVASGRPQVDRVQSILLPKRRFSAPTKLAWNGLKGTFIYGLAVQSALNNGDILREDVLELPKLGLDRSSSTQDIRRYQEQVRDRMPHSGATPLSAVDVVAKFIKWFSDYILKKVNENNASVQGCPITDKADVKWILTIPASWEESSNDLRAAARTAGLGEVQLVSETEAAAALMLEEQALPFGHHVSGQVGLS
ncbi:MAG: hypothetical protein Q9220_004298 [cf. Caloplaca sp. 1 TL-2023]